MKLRQKLQKLTTGQAWASSIDRFYHWQHPLKAKELLRDIDRKKLDTVCQKYHVPGEVKAWPKYTNVEPWIENAVHHVRSLRLDRGPKLNILDIGSGAGYFLFVLKHLGHEVCGLDLDEPKFYGEMFELLGLERIIWWIEAFEPLPSLARKFDLITAFAICFNGHGSDKVWGLKEWEFFLNDVNDRYLNPRGRIVLALNPEPYGRYTPELRDFFISRGAAIERNRIWISKPTVVPVPAAFSSSVSNMK
jgi:SAM-dependent methyltransferase